jgi:hypothetical protein
VQEEVRHTPEALQFGEEVLVEFGKRGEESIIQDPDLLIGAKERLQAVIPRASTTSWIRPGGSPPARRRKPDNEPGARRAPMRPVMGRALLSALESGVGGI